MHIAHKYILRDLGVMFNPWRKNLPLKKGNENGEIWVVGMPNGEDVRKCKEVIEAIKRKKRMTYIIKLIWRQPRQCSGGDPRHLRETHTHISKAEKLFETKKRCSYERKKKASRGFAWGEECPDYWIVGRVTLSEVF